MNKTAGEAYARTVDRRQYLEQHGYVVEEMWECELKTKMARDRAMNAFFKDQDFISRLDPREALMGGRTNATVLRCSVKDGEKIHYVDVCSLYVSFQLFALHFLIVGFVFS